MKRRRNLQCIGLLLSVVVPAKRTTLVEKRARALCVKLASLNDGTPMEYREVRLMARVLALNYETADGAIAYAIQKGWLTGEGEPTQSICLTDEGRAPQTGSKRTR
jgi:hypothetical protein